MHSSPRSHPRPHHLPSANDTAAMKQLVAEKKLEGDQILQKISKLQGASKERKKTTKKKEHKFQWLDESLKLNDERKTLEQDIERTLRILSSSGTGEGEIDALFGDVLKEHSESAQERQTTMNEILGGIRDLKISLGEMKAQPPTARVESNTDFRERLSAIKQIVAAQMANLDLEQESLDHELADMHRGLSQHQQSIPLSHSMSSHSSPFDSPFQSPSSTPRRILSQSSSSPSSPLSSRPSSASTARSIPYSTMSSTFSDSSQLTDANFVFQFDQMACKDTQLLENLHDEWNRMEHRFNNQLTDLRTRFLSQNDVQDIKLGTWDNKAHFHFMTIYKQYTHKGQREEFVERMEVEMPSKSRSEIESHFQFVRNQYLYRIHQKAIKGMWRRERVLWLEKAKELAQEANLLADQKMKKDIEAGEMQQKRQHLHKKLTTWREDKAKKFAQTMEDLQRQEQKALERERVLIERLARAKNVKKQLVTEYKQIKKEMNDQKSLEEEQQRQQEEELKQIQAQVNQERVNYRISETESKQQAIAQRRLEDQKMEQLKEIQLEKLREKVRVHAEIDTSRTQQGTVASTTHARILPPLFKANHGYATETIVGDTRFKIERALEKAGLLNTKYALEVLSSVPTKVRVDQLSSDQKEVYMKTRVT